MTTIARPTPTSLGEILDWFDTPFPLRGELAPTVRVEDYMEDGGYVLRAGSLASTPIVTSRSASTTAC